jgi:ketosteroid isomerase-like protein
LLDGANAGCVADDEQHMRHARDNDDDGSVFRIRPHLESFMPVNIKSRLTASKSLVAVAATAVVTLVPMTGDAAEDDAAVIRRQSQEFSDASASGDAAVLARYLDDRVIFMNEGGDMATKKDIVDGAQPSPKGTSNTLKQADLKVELHGNVAVTSFADLSTVQFHGQTLHAKYLSTEVWLREADGWKMISSQTMAAQDDPPAVTLPAKVLDEYVGRYEASPDYVYVIERHGGELSASANGSKPIALKAELRDVFFAPGQPRVRRIFQRDEKGHISGFVSRREGHDLVLKRVG